MIWPSIRFDISLQNFKKPLDIFSPQIERKRSKEYLVIILAVKESFERFSCLEFIFEKSKHREAGLKHKLKLEAWRLRIFRDTLILVFLNENCCLCICFTELYFFHWLLVVSLVILIAVSIVFSRSVNIACKSTQNDNKFFIMLERNSVNVHSITRHSSQYKSENRMAVWVILEIFLTVWLKAHAYFHRPQYWMSTICIAKLWNTAFCPKSVW